MTTGQIIILTSTIGLAIASYLFIRHLRIRDGVARLFFLVYTGTLVIFFTIRLLNQTLRLCGIIDPKQASQVTVTNTSLLLVPLVVILLIELYYKFK